MHKHPQSLMVGVLLFASINCEGETGQEDQSRSLGDTRETVAQAIVAGDVERIFSFWADDMLIYPVSEPAVRGIDAVREYGVVIERNSGWPPGRHPSKSSPPSQVILGTSLERTNGSTVRAVPPCPADT